MINIRRFLTFLYFMGLFWIIAGQNVFSIEFDSFNQEFNSNIVRDMTMKLIDYKGRKVLNGSIFYNIDVEQFDLSVIVRVPRKRGRISTLLNLTTNGCDLMEGRYKGYTQLAHMLMKYIRKATRNLPQRCPFRKGTELIFPNFFIDAEKLYPVFPETKYSCIFIMNVKKDFAYRMTLNGSVLTREKKRIA